MPGMMETVLNIGLNDESVLGLAEAAGDHRFAWDSYRRLISMFGKTVLGIDGEAFARELDQVKHDKGLKSDVDLDADDLRALVHRYQQIVLEQTGEAFPQHPREQMNLAISAVFRSWNTARARLYRQRERIPQDLGTAVNVCTMVFGNLGDTSGTGVAFTRNPATRNRWYLWGLPRQRAGRGRRRRHSQHRWAGRARPPRPAGVQPADGGHAPARDALS